MKSKSIECVLFVFVLLGVCLFQEYISTEIMQCFILSCDSMGLIFLLFSLVPNVCFCFWLPMLKCYSDMSKCVSGFFVLWCFGVLVVYNFQICITYFLFSLLACALMLVHSTCGHFCCVCRVHLSQIMVNYGQLWLWSICSSRRIKFSHEDMSLCCKLKLCTM